MKRKLIRLLGGVPETEVGFLWDSARLLIFTLDGGPTQDIPRRVRRLRFALTTTLPKLAKAHHVWQVVDWNAAYKAAHQPKKRPLLGA